METPDIPWLRQAITKGLMGLVVLHLEGGPPAETIDKTARVWYYVVKNWPVQWHEALDAPRISEAFCRLAANCQRWPAPRELRTYLPERRYAKPGLDAPEYPKEKAKENLQKLKAMLAGGIKKP